MRKALTVLAMAAFVTSGCVSSHMKKYLGKDVRYIEIDDGAPVNVIDMPDGRRAFQYRWGGGTYVTPQTTSTQGQVQLVGNQAYYTEQRVQSGGAVLQSAGCLITYFATWDPARKGWIVSSISYPKQAVC